MRGVDFSVSGDDDLSFGKNSNLKLGVNYSLDIDAWTHLILSGSVDIVGIRPGQLEEILKDYIALGGGSGLTVLTFDGSVKAQVTGETQFLTPSPTLSVGFELGAGGGYTWAHCREIKKDDLVIDVIKNAFTKARLPQSPVNSFGLKNNEVLLSRYTGFLKIGANASFGYAFTSSDLVGEVVKPLDLGTKLTLQAEAKIAAAYQLVGAFQVVVTDVKDPARDNWVRVIVEKDRTSTFDFALGVKVGVDLDTENSPSALALFDGVLGTSTQQVIEKALKYASDPETEIVDKFKAKVDGFTKEIIEKWTPKIFDEVDDELAQGLELLKKIRAVVKKGEEQIIGLYESIIDVTDISTRIDDIIQVLETDLDPQERKKQLLNLVNDPYIKALLEQILNRAFGDIFIQLESEKDKALITLKKIQTLINSDVETYVREFIKAKQDALGLTKLFEELKQYETVENLQENATDKIKELVERLIEKSFDELFALDNDEIEKIFKEIKSVAESFNQLLNDADKLIEKALNANGRFELSYAYRRQKKNEKLIDVEINVSEDAGKELYKKAVEADFTGLLLDENIPLLKINSALFTESLLKKSTLNIHLFGLNDYKGVSSILSNLESNVQVGASGLISVYKLRIEEKEKEETAHRMTEFGLILQIVGTVKGAFQADEKLKNLSVNAPALLKTMSNTVTYSISDTLTSLDELEAYFSLGLQMKVINSRQFHNLVTSLRKLRDMGMKGDNFGKVGVKYSFSFDPEALANALREKFAADLATIEDKNDYKKAYQAVLQRLCLEKLLSSYAIGPNTDARKIGVWALFKTGIFEDIKAKGPGFDPIVWNNQFGVLKFTANGRKWYLDVEDNDVIWAETMYHRIVDLSEFLYKFRQTLQGDNEITLQDLGDLLGKFIREMKDLNRKDYALRSLPILVLDEMVRRSSKNNTSTRTALLEITLYDKENPDKEAHYIPISG